MMKYLLMPAASATGRDFLLERLLANPDVVAREVGRDRINIGVMVKTTDRESRKTELTKRCVTSDEFSSGLERGDIIANYILESNGKRYGYHKDDFEPAGDFDVLVADASVYQIPDLKSHLGDRMHVAGMVATRQYREDNLRARGSENEEQILSRLNLGDAHTALLLIMGGKTELVPDFIHSDLYYAINNFKEDLSSHEFIRNFTGSDNVVTILKNLMTNNGGDGLIDELVVLGPEHFVTPQMDTNIVDTHFFKTGVNMIMNSLEGSVAFQ